MDSLIDLSHVIEDNMPVYPGDIKTNLFQTKYFGVNEYNDHRLDISMHVGTHIDSPMHFTDNNIYISQAKLESFIAQGFLLDVRNQPIISMKVEYENKIKEDSIVLIYTGWDKFYGTDKYYQEHPIVDANLCEFFKEKKVKMLGMDMPSPDKYPFEIHKLLLEDSIYIIENLVCLDKLLSVEHFEVIALPMKIKADSSMVRVVARIL